MWPFEAVRAYSDARSVVAGGGKLGMAMRITSEEAGSIQLMQIVAWAVVGILIIRMPTLQNWQLQGCGLQILMGIVFKELRACFGSECCSVDLANS